MGGGVGDEGGVTLLLIRKNDIFGSKISSFLLSITAIPFSSCARVQVRA